MQNEKIDHCSHCDLEDNIYYHDEYLCKNCSDDFKKKFTELASIEMEKYFQKHIKSHYIKIISALSKRKLYDMLSEYIEKEKLFIELFEYKKITKSELIGAVEELRLLADFSKYIEMRKNMS